MMTLRWVESEKSVEIIGLLPGCPPAPSYCPALYLHPPHLGLGPGLDHSEWLPDSECP